MSSEGHPIHIAAVAGNRAAKLGDEPARLAALRRMELLDTPPEPAFDRITAMVRTVLDVPIAVVALVDADRQWFKSRQGLDHAATSREISFCTHTIKARTPMVVANARADPRFSENPLVVGAPGICSYAGVPLETADGYNIGTLCAMDRVPRRFDENEVGILASFAALIVSEFELRQLAATDSLTGTLTRWALIRELGDAIEQRDRNDSPSALIVFDVDNFRSINERFGHPEGDRVLRGVVERATAAMRPGESIGRLGGEEFAVLLPNTELGTAKLSAERLRLAIAGAASVTSGGGVYVTASFGIAPLIPSIRLPEDWLALADEPLYEAKREGRNTCRVRRVPDFAA